MRLFAALLATVMLVVAEPAIAAPLEVYGQLPNIEQAELSPDGAQVAAIVTDGDVRMLVVRRLSDGQITRRVNTGQIKVRDVQWAGPDHLIITQSMTTMIMGLENARDEWYVAALFDLRNGKSRTLMQGDATAMNVVMGRPQVRTVNGRPMIFLTGVVFVNNQGAFSVFSADLDRPNVKLVEKGTPETNDWVLDATGRAVAESQYERRSGQWTLRLRETPGSSWKTVERRTDKFDHPALLGLARDGRSVLVREIIEGEAVVREISPAGVWGPVVARGEQWPMFDRATGQMSGLSEQEGDEATMNFLDVADHKVWKAVKAAYPDDRLTLVSWSDDRRKLVVKAESDTEPPAYALVDIRTGQATWLGFEYERLKSADIAPVTPITFKAADGLELSGYLTLPRGKAAKGLPLVVHPHGGPAARDSLGFDWWVQAMASRGYAVLQVNFRGSDGFGEKFLKAGFGEWGRKMQTDLSDGVRHLAKEGLIDPKRVCIVGASYGGYAALAGVALDADVYRCAVSVAGISDLRRFVAWSRVQNGISTQRYWVKFMGADDPRDPVLAAISPAAQVAEVRAPVLLIHGKDDTVVPLEQSRIMADALRAAGKPVEITVLTGEDHHLSRSATRLQTLQATVQFLEKHNPPH